MSKATDAARLHKETQHLYGVVAKSLFSSDSSVRKNAYEVSACDIDRDGRTRPAALRLLQEASIITRTETRNLYSVNGSPLYCVHGFKEHAQEYAEKPVFDTTYDKLYDTLTSSYRNTDRKLAGYEEIEHLGDAEAIWVYFNQKDYYIVKDTNDDIRCYPKEHEVERIKAVLQVLVEFEIQTNYNRYVERYLDLPPKAIYEDNTQDYRLRNFAHFPASLSDDMLKGYETEYKFYLDYMQKLHDNLLQYQALVASKGGCKNLIAQMRRDVIKKYDDDLLLHVNVDPEEKDPYYNNGLDMSKNTEDVVGLYKFIMEHSDCFNYEYLYGSEDVPFLNLAEVDNTTFDPPSSCRLTVDPNYVAPPEEVEVGVEEENNA